MNRIAFIMPIDRTISRNALSSIIDSMIEDHSIDIDFYNLISEKNVYSKKVLDEFYKNKNKYDAVVVLDLGYLFDYRIHKNNFHCPVVLIAGDDPQNFEVKKSFKHRVKRFFSYLLSTPKDRFLIGNSVCAKQYDIVFTHQKNMISKYIEKTINNVYWLPYWCDTNIYFENREIEKEFDVTTVMHPQLRRKVVLDKLENEPSFTFQNGVGNFNKDCSNFYQKGKMVFNMSNHGEVTMRIPEVLGTNSFLLTDKIDDKFGLNEMYENGKDFIHYENYDDLISKINYYLNNDTKRVEIANHAYQTTMQKHTQFIRTEQILNCIDGFSKQIEVDVSINIVSYGRPYLLKLTLESLKRSLKDSDLKLEIILLDQKSDELTKYIIREHYNFIDQVIYLDDNVGIAEAWNKMYEVSHGRYILPIENDWFCNSINDNWLKDAISILSSDNSLAFIKLRKLHDRQLGYGNINVEPWTVTPFPKDIIDVRALDDKEFYVTESKYSCFTFNPILMKKNFRDEFSEYYKDDPNNKTPLRSGEDLPTRKWREQSKWKSATLLNGPFEHIGFYGGKEFLRYLPLKIIKNSYYKLIRGI